MKIFWCVWDGQAGSIDNKKNCSTFLGRLFGHPFNRELFFGDLFSGNILSGDFFFQGTFFPRTESLTDYLIS